MGGNCGIIDISVVEAKRRPFIPEFGFRVESAVPYMLPKNNIVSQSIAPSYLGDSARYPVLEAASSVIKYRSILLKGVII